ncbi:TetR/AcrR family transcriptional regulator [Endozoicomonas montiporae]|uniref:Putative TetR family transcriptional regulator n=1 Tax=Endozoicomonas montiporae CL-33 TaxID=570277 RepID=A0A142BB23_9GAMM|nr:TetR/AcrR family transcriptional regulator [Endozoicomonas montiporae]AMO55949.1 putative TetR family transcriptional regulator [Endozoicomonas montiporae CL-33]
MSKPTTRDVILDTAERLFARQGIEAVSLRTINTEAGFSVAALHYHFRNRQGLIEALIERDQKPVLSRRQELLDELDTLVKPEVRQITEALVLPMAEPIIDNPEKGLQTIKFLFQTYIDQKNHRQVSEVIEESFRIFDRLLVSALPELDRNLLHQRWVVAAELTFQGLANIDNVMTLRPHQDERENYRDYVRRLIDFIAGGLAADASAA